mgnify:CR=1 FL=1
MGSHVWVLWHNWIAILTLGKCTAIPCRPVPNMGSDAVQLPSWWGTWVPVHYCIHIQCAYSKIRLSDRYWHEPIDCCGEGEHYTCTVKARSVGVWRQISDMASFWIRPEYVVDYRPILDAPVNAAGEVVEEIILYCWWCILWFRISAIIAVRCWWLVVVLYCFIICGVIFFVVAHFFKPSIFWSHLWKLLKEEMHPSLFFFAFWRSTPLFVHGSCFAWKSCSVVWCCSMRFYLHF